MENLTVSETSKAPETWLELPVSIWLRVMKYLEDEDISNIHLASKKFHEIANNYPHHIVISDDVDPEALENFPRICDDVKVEFYADEDSDEISEFFEMTGVHVKKLILRNLSWTADVLTDTLEAVPNIQSLDLDSIEIIEEENVNDDLLPIKFTKLRILKVSNIDSTRSREFMANLLDLFVCAPTEVSITHYSGQKIESFLQKHKDSIKKLKLFHCVDQQPNLTGFKLEHLNLDDGFEHKSPSILIPLLTEPNSLKFLHLGLNFTTAENLNFIFHNLEGLEVLELEIQGIMEAECYHQLSRFKNLSRLEISDESWDDRKDDLVLGLTAAVNEDLVELKTRCSEFTSDDYCELSRCLPNLKKFRIGRCVFKNLCYRTCFESLEELTVDYVCPDDLDFYYDTSTLQQMTKIQVLKIENLDHTLCKRDTKFLGHIFPALVKFSVFFCYPLRNNKPVLNILKNFTQLKTLVIDSPHVLEYSEITEEEYESLPLIRSLKKYRRNLEWVHIYYARYDGEILKKVLKDLKGLRFSSDYFDITI